MSVNEKAIVENTVEETQANKTSDKNDDVKQTSNLGLISKFKTSSIKKKQQSFLPRLRHWLRYLI